MVLKKITGIIIVVSLICFCFLSEKRIYSDIEKKLIKLFPVACVPGTDMRRIMAYYDHDPEKATVFSSYGLGKNNMIDYMGGDNTYDGHIGTDIGPAGFEEQDIGIPVAAVAEGVVNKVLDGVFDRETEYKKGVQGNFVLIDHGDGYMSYYNHLRKGSVCVSVGDTVTAGQQIGQLGSSGGSTWPHLHFEWRENNRSVDPFSGPENTIESRWLEQPPYDYPMVISDCGLYYPENRKKLPLISTRESCAVRGKSKDKKLQLWITVLNVMKEEHTRTWKLISPDKKYTNKRTDTIDGSKKWHGPGAEVWQYSYNAVFSKKASKGLWQMDIYHDETLAKRLYFTVSDEKPQNGPPSKPSGGTIFPKSPRTDDWITCQVDFQIKFLDPDLDKIRYRYEWCLNGKVVRNTTNATRADYFPANHAKPGDTLVCRVFASDGVLESEPLSFSVEYVE